MFHVTLFVSVFIIFLFSFNSSFLKVPDELVVNLVKPNGRIRGHILKSSRGNDFYAFQDIPFAAPPIGNKRFKEPQYHDGWDGILNVTENKKICVQFHPSPDAQLLHGETEDCLVLNVYTPMKPGSYSSLSVLFWTYGGGFFEGSARIEDYNPKYFMDENIVVVTSNYRLGPLGFLSTADDVIPGNMGLKDQHLALTWTVKNIHLFGGDAQKIVIAGHSAGAYSTGFQVLSDKNRGFFRGVIQQSGSPLADVGFQTDPKQYAIQIIKGLDQDKFDPRNNTRHLEILQNASIDEIRRVAKTIVNKEFPNGFMLTMIWAPVMENKKSNDAIVTAPMRQDFQEGNFNRVPTLIGLVSEESLHFLPDPTFEQSAQRFDNDSSLLIHPRLNVDYGDRKIVGRLLKAIYTSSTFLEDKLALIKFTSDAVFSRAVIEQANLMSRHVPVFLYQFCLSRNDISSYPGAPHTSELPYIWYGFDDTVESNLRENSRVQMMKMWTNFIKYLNPTPEEDSSLQNINWPKLHPTTMEYVNINKTLSIKTNPRSYIEMRTLLNEYIQQPFNVY